MHNALAFESIEPTIKSLMPFNAVVYKDPNVDGGT